MIPSQSIAVRSAEARDAVKLAELLGELGYPAPANAVPERLTRLTDVGALTLVAELEGEVTGMVTVHVFPAITHAESIAQLTSLAVREGARSKGVGARLVAAAEDWARTQGSERIIVTTALHRERAHEFYEKNGYEFTGKRYAKLLASRLGP